ncbi:MAG TPA: glycosyltransferase [Kribbella sp.]|nr:glycosyltransferase [Kribbella sp.]
MPESSPRSEAETMVGEGAEPHVVMLVANDITNDSRVRKEATAIAQTGARVTLLGVAPDGRQSMESLPGGALIVRVPVAFQLRNERIRRRKARRIWRLPLIGYRTGPAQAVRRVKIAAHLTDIKAGSGLALAGRRAGAIGPLRYKAGVLVRVVRQRRWQLALTAARVRAGLTRWENRLFAGGWRIWDGVVSRSTWPARWRGVLPEAYDYEIAFGDLIDKLVPDVVHAHDMHVIAVAVRAAGRARLRGRDLKVIYDAHEYVPGLSRYGGRTPRFIAAWARHEREYIRATDRVITVSPAIARVLHRRHRLDREPTVIINTPSLSDASAEVTDLRTQLGLSAEVPLLVYSGGVTRARGVETAVEALVQLPDVHLAVVSVPCVAIGPVRELDALAVSRGVADRVHFVNPVEPRQVVAFLRSADVGLIPILRYPSHEMSLPNKVFEYAFAGLPVVASNMPSLTEFLTRTGIGEVFEVQNPVDLAAKVRRVLESPQAYHERLARQEFQHEMSWERQADHLRVLYGDLLNRPLAAGETTPTGVGTPAAERPATPRVLIGPANSAGQAWQWARAIERHAPPAVARSLMTTDRFSFRADHTATYQQYRNDVLWQIRFASYALREFTHILFESGRPMFGQRPAQLFDVDLPTLSTAGIAHGLILHGSEVRDPRRHRQRYPYSPFADERNGEVVRLQRVVDVMQQLLAGYDGSRFVTTLDLLEYVEDSQWLPVVVDPDQLASPHPVLDRRIPVVLHAPSRSALKGSLFVDPVLQDLDEQGLIEYRRVEGVPHAELMELVRDADIVIDQLLLGSYGVFACEAMAAGRVTVGHVADHVRAQLPTELPIVEATPDDLREVLERLVEDRGPARKLAEAGPDYVRQLHDGRKSVEVLMPFLTGDLEA